MNFWTEWIVQWINEKKHHNYSEWSTSSWSKAVIAKQSRQSLSWFCQINWVSLDSFYASAAPITNGAPNGWPWKDIIYVAEWNNSASTLASNWRSYSSRRHGIPWPMALNAFEWYAGESLTFFNHPHGPHDIPQPWAGVYNLPTSEAREIEFLKTLDKFQQRTLCLDRGPGASWCILGIPGVQPDGTHGTPRFLCSGCLNMELFGGYCGIGIDPGL